MVKFTVQKLSVGGAPRATSAFYSVKLCISGRQRTYFHPPVFLQTDVTALQTQRGLGIFGQKTAPSNSPVQRFLWKIEYLRRYFNRIAISYKLGNGSFDLSHKTLSNDDEKKFRFLFLTTLTNFYFICSYLQGNTAISN